MTPHILTETLPLTGAIAATGWFFWMRFQALELRFDRIEERIAAVEHKAELNRQAMQSNDDRHDYLIHANTELINHRTDRLRSEMQAVDMRLGKDIDEVKGYLARTTDFVVRREA